MKKLLTIILLLFAGAVRAQTYSLGDANIPTSAVKGSTIIVGQNNRVAYLQPAPSTGNYVKVTINGVEQWVTIASLTTGIVGAQGPQGVPGPVGPQGPAGAFPAATEGQVPVFHNGSWVSAQAGMTIAQNYLPAQVGSATVCSGVTSLAQGYDISSTLNINSFTTGTVQMFCDYTDAMGNAVTQQLPMYTGSIQKGAQTTITIIPKVGMPIKIYVVCSPDWIGTYECWGRIHQS